MSPHIQGERKDQAKAKYQAAKIGFRTGLDPSRQLLPCATGKQFIPKLSLCSIEKEIKM